MWHQGSHVGVQNNSEKNILGISFYYYAKLERHFATVLYTNMAVSSREWKPRIAGLMLTIAENPFKFMQEKIKKCTLLYLMNPELA